jgi:hypothetical protein
MQADIKLSRRLAGCTRKRLGELDFSSVEDGRQGDCKWSLPLILKQVLVGMMAGQKGLGEVEEGFFAMSMFMRNVLGFHRRIPDTTMRGALIKTGIESLCEVLHQTVFLALRRKALHIVGLPFHVVALDGKKTSTRIGDDGQMAQTVSDYEGETPKFSVATITACLTSTPSKICLDAIPMPASTNEKGFFKVVLQSLLDTYGPLFKMVTYDAGGNSKENAKFVHDQGLFYLFALKKDQPTLFGRAKELLANLGPELSLSTTDEILSGERVIRRVWATTAMRGFYWSHLQVVLRVESQTIDPKTGVVKETHSRYFVTNAPTETLSPEQWLLVVRSHWAVENNCHNTFDKIFQEDKRPFILQPHGMLVAMVLRRIAYNLLSLFRSVTQRSDPKKQMPWKSLMRSVSLMLAKLEQHNLVSGSRLALRLGAG